MIAEAAYYLAQKRGFLGRHALDDWITAEQQVRQAISPIRKSKNDATAQMPPEPGARKSAALPISSKTDKYMPTQPESREPISIDDDVDAIAREALQETPHIEDAERYRTNPGPVVPPQQSVAGP